MPSDLAARTQHGGRADPDGLDDRADGETGLRQAHRQNRRKDVGPVDVQDDVGVVGVDLVRDDVADDPAHPHELAVEPSAEELGGRDGDGLGGRSGGDDLQGLAPGVGAARASAEVDAPGDPHARAGGHGEIRPGDALLAQDHVA